MTGRSACRYETSTTTPSAALPADRVGSLGATRVLANQLFGVSPSDPVTFAAVPVLLAAVAAVACYLPARRASRLDPLVALRRE